MDEIAISTLKVPRERIGAIIGKGGETKRKLEELGTSGLRIDSSTGEVTVIQKDDPLRARQMVSVIQAISRGFSPERAVTLLNDDFFLHVISLKDYAKPGSRRMNEIRARIIGSSGKTRRIIEELTDTYLSVYGDTVSIIGDYVSLEYSVRAVGMLLSGRKHRTVYQFLEKSSRELKFRRIEEGFK